MNEKAIGLLMEHNIEVNKAARARGGFVCETSKGLYLFKEYDVKERHFRFEQNIMKILEEAGCKADYFRTFDDENIIIESDDGKKYVLKQWYSSRECNIKDRNDVVKSAGLLGRVHTLMQGNVSDEKTDLYPCDLRDEFLRHTVEIKRTRNYVRKKNNKNSFENALLKHIDEFYGEAEQALAELDTCDYKTLRTLAYENQTVCHGAFNHHNIIFVGKEPVLVDFKNAVIDVQITDLYDFIRKVMEKYNWDVTLGNELIEAYNNEKPIDTAERRLLYIMLKYPEKFWKIANKYFNSNKAWIPEKNMEKLRMVVEQADVKKKFVDTIL